VWKGEGVGRTGSLLFPPKLAGRRHVVRGRYISPLTVFSAVTRSFAEQSQEYRQN
jgi:hypothetical protein